VVTPEVSGLQFELAPSCGVLLRLGLVSDQDGGIAAKVKNGEAQINRQLSLPRAPRPSCMLSEVFG
jgi:hypothetical protein